MCSSSCLPGGGSNTELALHSLHLCDGDAVVNMINTFPLLLFYFCQLTIKYCPTKTSCHNSFLLQYSFKNPSSLNCLSALPSCPPSSPVQATLEKLLFSQPSLTGDYHYSGKPLTLTSTFNLNPHGWFAMLTLDVLHLAATSLTELELQGTAWYASLEQYSRSGPEAHPLLSCRALRVWLLRLVLLGCRAGPMTCWYLLSLSLLASLPVALPFVSVGSDFWTEAEKSLFSAALETYGKEFSLIQKMVRSHFLSGFLMEGAHVSSLFVPIKMLFF